MGAELKEQKKAHINRLFDKMIDRLLKLDMDHSDLEEVRRLAMGVEASARLRQILLKQRPKQSLFPLEGKSEDISNLSQLEGKSEDVSSLTWVGEPKDADKKESDREEVTGPDQESGEEDSGTGLEGSRG